MKRTLLSLLICVGVFFGMFVLGHPRQTEDIVSYRLEDGELEVFPPSRPLFHIPLVELHMINVCLKAKVYSSAQNRVIFCLEGILTDIGARQKYCSSHGRAMLNEELKRVQDGIAAAAEDAAAKAKKEGVGTEKWWSQ